jgi:L-aminopeptidase/D-esterase-like protein
VVEEWKWRGVPVWYHAGMICTGETYKNAVPYSGNIFQSKVPAAVYVGNGFGKLIGTAQIDELGNLETPIVLTNTSAYRPRRTR